VLWITVAVASLLFAMSHGATAHAASFTRGFVDDVWFDGPADGLSEQNWITKTVKTGAKLVQIEVDWAGIEPNAPTAADNPTSPSGPQFDFSSLDQRVEEFAHSGLQPVFLVTDAPRWAEGGGGTAADYATGGYKPNAAALGGLAAAMARRYSGHYQDPLHPGAELPRIRYFQVWAEANLDNHLSPQWTRQGGKLINTGPIIYRQMLNAFYAGVKAGDPSAKVLITGFGPYGDLPDTGQRRTQPVTFLDNLLCLSANLKRMACPQPTHFDILAADPYDVDAPTIHAASPLDASAPDLNRLTRVVAAARQAHTVLPNTPKPLWVTEFGYDSNPPNRSAVSLATQARWLLLGLYTFWHEGAQAAFWYLVRDQAPPYSINYFSGVYFRNGKPKPSYTAYRFPLVVMPGSNHRTEVWGIAPVSGTVQIQRKAGGGWAKVTTVHGSAGSVFDLLLATQPAGKYRGLVHGQASLAWTYRP
jgi:hypothetical protein